jgi:uncharacterized membrane protein YfcA
LAVPLLLYLVGLAYLDEYPPDFLDHLVIGTTALSVGLNAYIKRVYPLEEGKHGGEDGGCLRRGGRPRQPRGG